MIQDPALPRPPFCRSSSLAERLWRQGSAILAFFLVAGFTAPGKASAGDEAAEELIVFTRDSGSEIARRFAGEHLPALRQTARELGLAWRQVDAGLGAPPEVRLTPLLVYQDARGRTIYEGRYTDLEQLRHFVRTRRAVASEGWSGQHRRQEVAVLELGKSRIAAPVKITHLEGVLPDGHDPRAFHDRALAAIEAGWRQLEVRPEVELGPADRLFYLDFHPHRSADGVLSITVQLFSQFHCLEPVWSRLGDPVAGPFAEAPALFAAAARLLEDELQRQIRASSRGDGFDPLPASIPIRGWDELGLELPRAPAVSAAKRAPAAVALPRRWTLEDGAEPRLLFRFPPPLERYSGEVSELEGRLILGADGSLAGARGWASAATASVTMGERTLDKAIHEKMLDVAHFPKARFVLRRIESAAPRLALGRVSPVVVEGSFELLGRRIPLVARGEIEPTIGDDGAPRLRVDATWRLRLRDPFGLDGPDGPSDARDTLVFHLRARMAEQR